MYGLLEAKRAGVRVNPQAMERGFKVLREWANDQKRSLSLGGETATMAMTAYVLAHSGEPDAGLNARLFELRQALPVYGKAFLLRALLRSQAETQQIQTLTEEIASSAHISQGRAQIKETQTGLGSYMSSDTRSSAIVLSALLEVDRNHPLVAPLVSGLKKARRGDGRWSNTQENIYAMVALADYAREQAQGNTSVRIELDGNKLSQRLLRGGEVYRFSRSLKQIKPGELIITSQTPLFYTIRMTQVRDVGEDDTLSAGFALSRQYLDFETEQPIERIRLGQLIKVRLDVQTDQDRNYVALIDPIPAGCEAVNTELATEASVLGDKDRTSYVWDYRELRDDRIGAFADHMRAGSYRLDYLLRATIAGKFTVKPAYTEAMYEPDNLGRTAVAHLEVDR